MANGAICQGPLRDATIRYACDITPKTHTHTHKHIFQRKLLANITHACRHSSPKFPARCWHTRSITQTHTYSIYTCTHAQTHILFN